MSVDIRPVQSTDRAAWGVLYAAYAEFYQVTQTEDMRDRVWSWLMAPDHEVTGLVATRGASLVGLAHMRRFARPLAASTGYFLDDLFVAQAARGAGAADALLATAGEYAKAQGSGLLRWITAADNARARAVYDRTADATTWVTYDLTLA